MSDAGRTHHGLDYIEFTVNDMTKNQEFYSAAFGWSFTPYGPDYAGIVIGGKEEGSRCFTEISPSRWWDDLAGAVRIPRWAPIPLRGPERQCAGRVG